MKYAHFGEDIIRHIRLGLYSLNPRRDERDTDHHQIKNVEIITTERTPMEECSICCHLHTGEARANENKSNQMYICDI